MIQLLYPKALVPWGQIQSQKLQKNAKSIQILLLLAFWPHQWSQRPRSQRKIPRTKNNEQNFHHTPEPTVSTCAMPTLLDADHTTNSSTSGTISAPADNANEHLFMLKQIRDSFFDQDNMQDTFEKLIVGKDFCENDYMSEIIVRCIKHQLWPMYTELGVALLQDCPHLILCYREMNYKQLHALQATWELIVLHNHLFCILQAPKNEAESK